jgi:AcrR family transcriptional regulator
VPTATWQNLPEAKRARVLEAAMREFGTQGFSAGSLNVVARDAGIAKGSLFQYFADKGDLFAYVCDAVSLRVRAHMLERMAALDPSRELFEFLAELLVDWTEYFRDCPLERGVTAAANLEIDPQVRTTVRSVTYGYYLAALRPLLEDARARGDLRPDADLDAFLSLLLLVLPHLALAPFTPGLDPVLGLYGTDRDELTEQVARLVASLRAAFGS